MNDTENLEIFAKDFLKLQKDKFLRFLEQNRACSKLTIKVYNWAIAEAIEGVKIYESRRTLDFMAFREAISDQKPNTIAKKVSAVRSFLSFLESQNYKFYVKSLNSAKTPKALPKPASHKHILEALSELNKDDALLIEVLYGLGLRINEARTLKIADIGEKFARVIGKGAKTRQAPILPKLREKISEFIAEREPKIYLFEEKGRELSDNKIRYKVTKAFARVGLKVTPHQLRHAFATETLNGGASIADVSEILGHSRLATTEIYTKLSSSKKLKSYLEAHPLCRSE
ncbi:MAG: tyrosine-type recombinase/integrase [Helicobacteraceae bacterium]|jgi:integrase/recombinase XerC|nr:tyrosine-type recombinase/integrase [Helicobacteraceae bacterium]